MKAVCMMGPIHTVAEQDDWSEHGAPNDPPCDYCGECDACRREAAEDNAAIDDEPAFVGTVEELEQWLAAQGENGPDGKETP